MSPYRTLELVDDSSRCPRARILPYTAKPLATGRRGRSDPPSRNARRRPGARVPVRPLPRLHEVERHHDPEHGPRGAALARELRGEASTLRRGDGPACICLRGAHQRRHRPGPYRGVCWDADRLNLWRVGIYRILGSSRRRRQEARNASRGRATLQQEQFAWCSLTPGFQASRRSLVTIR